MKIFFCVIFVLLWHSASSYRSFAVTTPYWGGNKGLSPHRTALPHLNQVSFHHGIDNSVKESRLLKTLKAADIPNKLTISRMLAIPLFCASFQQDCQPVTVGLYAAASMTDYLDGYLARKWNQSSAFGSFLDPVADKLMVITALILLTSRFPSLLFVFPVALITAREVGVSALREFMASHGKRSDVKVGAVGKLKTVFQMVATTLLLLVHPDQSGQLDLCRRMGLEKHVVFAIGLLSLYMSTALSTWSGVQYLRAAWPTLTAVPANAPEEKVNFVG